MKAKQLLADFSLLLITIIWGTGFVFTKIILDGGVSAYMILAYRGLFALIFMTPFVFKHIKTITKADLVRGFILGTLLFLAFAFQTVGAAITTPSKNAFLTTLNVIFVPILLVVLFKNKLNPFALIAAPFAFVGTALMTIGNQLINQLLGYTNEQSMGLALNIGDVLTVICAVFWALHVIATGYFVKKSSVIKLTYLQFIPVFIFSVIIGVFIEQSPVVIDMVPFLSILYMSVFGMVLGFGVQTWAMNYSSPQKTSIIFTFEGVFGALFSVLFYSEVLTIWGIYGGIFIFVAVLISEVPSYLTNYRSRKLELKGT